MAYIVTLKILVDLDEAKAEKCVVQLLTPEPCVIDYQVVALERTADELDDSLVNETYSPGDAFRNWVLFSRTEADAFEGDGYWSNEYGWGSVDLATRFDPIQLDRPQTGKQDDVVMLLDPTAR